MKVATSAQMRQIDSIAVNQYGIPGVVLMENAGRRVAEEAARLLEGLVPRVVLFAGKGNNGGDIMVAARHLFNSGVEVKVFLLAREEDVRGDSRINLDIAKKMNIPVLPLVEEGHLQEAQRALDWGQVVVDGIFGTGLKGEVGGIPREVIRLINSSGCRVVSADIPSGVQGDTGEICGECVKADLTVTFGYPKVGLLQYPGAEYTGRLVVADISIPHSIGEDIGLNTHLLTGRYIAGFIPPRRPDTHKGTYGRGLIVGGSEGMTGAVALASTGCLKSGTGLIKAAVPAALNNILENKLTEVMTVALGDRDSTRLGISSIDKLKKLMEEADAVAIGPGMGVDSERVELVGFILKGSTVPLVLDADALNCIALDVKLLEKSSVPVIITPHPGEMARLMKCSIGEIQKDRVAAARYFSQKWRVITVLKGANTVIASPQGNIYINTTGNPGMASGGMGDVLTGVITGLLCQGLEPVQAACAGVYLHGLAGDIAASEIGEYGITAGQVAECIPAAIKLIRERSDEHDGKGCNDKGCHYS